MIEVGKEFIDEHYASETKTHWILYCPFCPERGKSPDDKGKLYVDKRIYKGHCFRCKASIRYCDDGFKNLSSELDRELKELGYVESITPISYFDLMFPPEKNNNKQLESLICERSDQYLDLIPQCDLRYYEVPKYKGIVIPFYDYRNILAYQIRWKEKPDYLGKYWTTPGRKPFFAIDRQPYALHREITLVEGVFDNFGAYKLGLPNPRSILGSSITDFNLEKLKQNIFLSHILIYLDETELSEQVAKQLRESRIKTPISIVLSDGTDPDEKFRSKDRKLQLRKY